MNNIQANTNVAFGSFAINSGTTASTIQNGSSTWTAAFPNFLQVLLGSVQPEAQPADADAYVSESTSDVEGSESFRRTSSTDTKDAKKSSDSDSLAGTFMRSMLAVNLVMAPVQQFVPVATGTTMTATSGWNAVSGTASVSASTVETSTSAPEVQQATVTVPVRNEEMSAPKTNVVNETAVKTAEPQIAGQIEGEATSAPKVNSRAIRTAVGNVAFELNLAPKSNVAESVKNVYSANTLLANRVAEGRREESGFKVSAPKASAAYATVTPAATTTFTAPAFEAVETKQDAAKESAPATRTEAHEAQTVRPQAAVQEIAMRLGSDSNPVDVTLRTRGGQVQVAVRTSDAALQDSLREELGTLVKALERTGFDAKAFAPAASQNEFGQTLNFGNESGRGNRNGARDQRQKLNARRATIEFMEAAA